MGAAAGRSRRRDTALLPHRDPPSGDPELRGQGLRPSLRMVTEWSLPVDLAVGVMPGLGGQNNADGERYVAGIFGVVLGRAWSERWRSFVERALPHRGSEANGGTEACMDFGSARLISPRVQIDAAGSLGLTRYGARTSLDAGAFLALLTRSDGWPPRASSSAQRIGNRGARASPAPAPT